MGEHVLFRLEQDGVLTRLDLQRLKEPYVRELAERVLGRPSAPPGLAAWLFRESQGNPLYAVSLLDAYSTPVVDLAAPRLAAIPQALSARVAERVQALGLFVGRGYQALAARSLALLGRCLVTRDREAAVGRLRKAVEMFDVCGCSWRCDHVLDTLRHLGKPGQRAVAASTGPGSLTVREREITALAVQGMSATAIGELLHIGERTVESHLARVYVKFGVHSRQQLAHAIALHTGGNDFRSSAAQDGPDASTARISP
ncbi:MAG TPA: helix-turn-helix transcriptional regulator [Propionibacteriaceae bacterium]